MRVTDHTKLESHLRAQDPAAGTLWSDHPLRGCSGRAQLRQHCFPGGFWLGQGPLSQGQRYCGQRPVDQMHPADRCPTTHAAVQRLVSLWSLQKEKVDVLQVHPPARRGLRKGAAVQSPRVSLCVCVLCEFVCVRFVCVCVCLRKILFTMLSALLLMRKHFVCHGDLFHLFFCKAQQQKQKQHRTPEAAARAREAALAATAKLNPAATPARAPLTAAAAAAAAAATVAKDDEGGIEGNAKFPYVILESPKIVKKFVKPARSDSSNALTPVPADM